MSTKVDKFQNWIKELWQGSSAGESARLIPVRSRVRISPLLFFYTNLKTLKRKITNWFVAPTIATNWVSFASALVRLVLLAYDVGESLPCYLEGFDTPSFLMQIFSKTYFKFQSLLHHLWSIDMMGWGCRRNILNARFGNRKHHRD